MPRCRLQNKVYIVDIEFFDSLIKSNLSEQGVVYSRTEINKFSYMTKSNALYDIQTLDDLTMIDEVVVDKRNFKRSRDKKGRRDRHLKNQLIKNTLTSLLKSPETIL